MPFRLPSSMGCSRRISASVVADIEVVNADMVDHIGIVACSAEGAALCYRTICIEGAKLLGPHAHPEVSMHTHALGDYMECIYRGDWEGVGALMLSSADKLSKIADHVDTLPPVVILRLRYMTAIDGTGLRAFEDLSDRLRLSGRTLILCGAREQPAAVMKQAQFHAHVGDGNICPNIEAALRRASEVYAAKAA